MEKISALMDGELDDDQMARELARLRASDELRHSWDTFHLIGDALRGEGILSGDFDGRFKRQLAQEPTVLAPRRSSTVKRFTTYALSAAASLAAIALVGWLAFFDNSLAPQPEIAKAPSTSPAVPVPPSQIANVPSDGTMNEYLIAHQEFSPSTAIQGLAPYVRTVSGTQRKAGR